MRMPYPIQAVVRVIMAPLLLCGGLSAADIRVDPAASGTNTGASWANARISLTAALAAATSGDNVWVKAGTYRPAAVGGSTGSTFTIPAGVSIYGGLLGFESSLNCRNWQVNQTILSGDLNSDDSGAYSSSNAASRTDNCLHVVTMGAGARLDGFFVQSGNAIATAGGGITDGNNAVSVENCWIRDNYARYGGGAMMNNIGTTVRRCIFGGNAGGDGAGMYARIGTDISRCVFVGNISNGWGGGLLIDTNGPTVGNCLFLQNQANFGGAVSVISGATPLLAYLTVTGNSVAQYGGGLWVEGASTVNVKNSIFDGNSATLGSPDGCLNSGTLNYYNSRAYITGSSTVFATGSGNFSAAPAFQGVIDPRGSDGIWLTGDDKYGPTSSAAQINKGAVVAGVTLDLRGITRQVTTPDAGAYEYGSGAGQEIGLTTSPNGAAPSIYSSLNPTGVVGQTFSYRIAATNMAYAISGTAQGSFQFGISVGTLPAGLALDTVTGLITGTPSGVGVSNVTVSATNYIGSGTAGLSITISQLTPSITSSTLALGTAGSNFTYQITGSNSPTSYSATGLPAGLSINTGTGAITGTPSVAGTYPVTIGATNTGGTGTVSLTIALSAIAGAPAVTSNLASAGIVGSAFSYQITGSNTPTSFNATGLPSGLTVNTITGLISGTPTTAAVSNVTISAINAPGSGSATLVITMSAASSGGGSTSSASSGGGGGGCGVGGATALIIGLLAILGLCRRR